MKTNIILKTLFTILALVFCFTFSVLSQTTNGNLTVPLSANEIHVFFDFPADGAFGIKTFTLEANIGSIKTGISARSREVESDFELQVKELNSNFKQELIANSGMQNFDFSFENPTKQVLTLQIKGHGKFYLSIIFPKGISNIKFVNQNKNIPATEKAKYVGFQYYQSQVPKGWKYLGGWLVTDLPQSSLVVSTLTLQTSKSPYPTILSFEEIVENSTPADKIMVNEILDVLKLPLIRKNEVFVMGECSLNGKPDSEIFGIALNTNREVYTKILKAWRANSVTRKFEIIPVKGIKCANEGYGV